MSVEESLARLKEKAYYARIAAALDSTLKRARGEAKERGLKLDLGTDNWILVSDQHRGVRDGADDFRLCEPAYNAALAYYFKKGHTLFVLGDAEDFWEERPAPIIRSYRRSLEMEADFHRQGRYYRLWGNHDDLWSFPSRVDKLLGPLFGPELRVSEALLAPVQDNGQRIGEILLAHGHQGSQSSDRWSRWSRLAVRLVWRPFQRLTQYSPNLPSQDWELREKHDVALYTWAALQPGLMLIAGHTHRPTFASQSRSADLLSQLSSLEDELADRLESIELRERVAQVAAELEWIKALEFRKPGGQPIVPMQKPCYFNTGCCCFQDGDITALEITRGEIRLVRWPDDDGRIRPQILARSPLRGLLERC